jgi:hypothetical protein
VVVLVAAAAAAAAAAFVAAAGAPQREGRDCRGGGGVGPLQGAAVGLRPLLPWARATRGGRSCCRFLFCLVLVLFFLGAVVVRERRWPGRKKGDGGKRFGEEERLGEQAFSRFSVSVAFSLESRVGTGARERESKSKRERERKRERKSTRPIAPHFVASKPPSRPLLRLVA